MTTTAFCTVDRVTSLDLFMSSLEAICLVHDMPKSDVAGSDPVSFLQSVKYEKSSVDLVDNEYERVDLRS